ncbi:MAG: hypothetical protein GY719_26565 [bacterium]|nr:hypothetical protein [bacterium]
MTTMSRVLTLCLTLSWCAASLPAQPVPVGDDFQVNSLTTDDQIVPSVAVSPNGDFVVVWEFDYYSGGPFKGLLDGSGIRGQRYASDGTLLGGEFQVNSYTTGDQTRPDVAADSAGGFIVVWDSNGSSGADTSFRSIQGQRYASDGTALGAQFEVNSYTTNTQAAARVAVGPGGAFVVVWETYGASVGTDTAGDGISGRRFASDGTPVGSDFQVNTYTTANQRLGGVGIGPGGEFTVVWNSFGSGGTDSSLWSVHGQRYASDGMPAGGQFQVNTHTTSSQFSSDLAVAPNGEAIVVWESTDPVPPDTDGRSIQGQRYASDGMPLGGEFVVNSYTTSTQGSPSITVDSSGEFTVVWESSGSAGNDAAYQSIQTRRLDSSGAPVGQDFQVNTYTTDRQTAAVVSAVAADAFVVAWESDGSSGTDSSQSSVQARRFGPTNPVLGIAKAAGATVDNGGGTFTVALTFVLENLGNVPIDNVQVTDDLAATFPGVPFSVTSLTSPVFTVNPTFDGLGDTALLAGSDVLLTNSTNSILLELTVGPGAAGLFFNSATATGSSPAGAALSDLSQDGTSPDPDGNGDPADNDEPTPIQISMPPGVVEIPTLQGWWLLVLAGLLALAGQRIIHRQAARRPPDRRHLR